MQRSLAFKNLFQINLWVALILGSLSFVYLSVLDPDIYKALAIAIMGGVVILSIGTVGIYIMGFTQFETRQLRMDKKQKLIRYLVSYITSPLIYIVVWILFSPLTHEQPFRWMEIQLLVIVVPSSWLINTLILMLYNYSVLQYMKVQSEIENLQLKAIISETANQVLKQQIQPHFLFNVLNTVKSLYKQDIVQGETYLVHLANFLRASISNPAAKIVRLEDELQLCRDYIEMQRIRFGDALTYQVDLPQEITHQKYVPYFSLQTLLENAIKHNDLTEQSPLNIAVLHEGEYIKVINNLQVRHFKEPSTGQGLYNLAERYRLLTGDEIHIYQSKNYFAVRIKLLDDDDSNHRG